MPLNTTLTSWEQVAAIADQCSYIAKENGKDCWVGVHGKPETTGEDVTLFQRDVDSALATGRIGIRSSVGGALNVSNMRQQERK